MTQIYKVTTEGDCEGRTTETLGYATGDPKLIEEYYQERKMYSIKLEPINIIQVTGGTTQQRRTLRSKRTILLEDIKHLEQQLENLGEDIRR